jgi:hypothetical protein
MFSTRTAGRTVNELPVSHSQVKASTVPFASNTILAIKIMIELIKQWPQLGLLRAETKWLQ